MAAVVVAAAVATAAVTKIVNEICIVSFCSGDTLIFFFQEITSHLLIFFSGAGSTI